jgi:hypothetical protein
MARTNTEILLEVVARLGPLASEFVFVGGCTVGLLITDEAAAGVRPTKDVDGIIDADTYSKYAEFERQLEHAGFQRDLDGPICRWENDGWLLDVIPIDGAFLGFKGKWFKAAFETSERHELIRGTEIRVISPVYFLATKLEAFNDRGRNDFLGSSDLEDIITLLNGREEILAEVRMAERNVREFISDSLNDLLNDPRFTASLPGHLMPDTERVRTVLERLVNLTAIEQ